MDGIEAIYEYIGESKNYYIYEPEEGSELMGKMYVRKVATSGPPEKHIRVTLCANVD